MDLLKSTLYIRDYFYTTLSGTDISYRALTYMELENIQNKYNQKQNLSRVITVKKALENPEDFTLLNSRDIDKLATTILEVSTITNSEVQKIEHSVTIVLDDSFKDDSFKSCKLCQERKLDIHRNCPLLDLETHDKGVFYLVGQEKLNICPMDDVNSPLVNDAFRAYGMYDKGLLPGVGGLYNQTMFFTEISSLVKGIINNNQAKAMAKK